VHCLLGALGGAYRPGHEAPRPRQRNGGLKAFDSGATSFRAPSGPNVPEVRWPSRGVARRREGRARAARIHGRGAPKNIPFHEPRRPMPPDPRAGPGRELAIPCGRPNRHRAKT
jgi:hypothetical protein